jgi:hypothetical protein
MGLWNLLPETLKTIMPAQKCEELVKGNISMMDGSVDINELTPVMENKYNNKENPRFVPILVTKSTFEDTDCDEEQVATFIVSSSSAQGGTMVCVNGAGGVSCHDGNSNEPGFKVFEIPVLPVPGYGRHVEF